MTKFLIADPLHINKKNFASLYDYLAEAKANVTLHEIPAEWLSAFGDYTDKQDELTEEYSRLCALSETELFQAETKQVNLFKCARAETLSLLITQEHLRDIEIPKVLAELFSLIYSTNKELLLWNLAAASYWINYWTMVIKTKSPKNVLVFSGSLTYARSLLEVLKNSTPRAFVLESFFTGNDNYIEEKYEPIANNSNLKHTGYYKSLAQNISRDNQDRERNKAINKIITAKNKNVVQPAKDDTRLFSNLNRTILITGQVINDFSLLEYKGIGLNSIKFYKELISRLLEKTDVNIIFKAHPWERKKKNVNFPLTASSLETHFSKIDENYRTRLAIVEDHNIESLFRQSDYVLGLNSQALLEAAFHGFQPIQFADAFYGRKGFTTDYSISQIDDFIEDVRSGAILSRLGLEQYRRYEEFITKSLQFSLVSSFPSGKIRLKEIFKSESRIIIGPQPAPNTNMHSTTKTIAKAATEISANIPQLKLSEPKNSEQTTNMSKETVRPKKKNKWIKFYKSPKKFFFDSKNKKIWWIHYLIPGSVK